MKTSQEGVDLIKEFEGFRDTAYQDIVGVWTIGFGTTQYGEGRPVKQGDKVTKERAEEILRGDLMHFENCVNKLVKTPLSQNQFDAIVCFTYNLGCGSLGKSTLLKKVNINPSDATIADEFRKWNRAGGKVVAGLARRREAEAKLYFKP